LAPPRVGGEPFLDAAVRSQLIWRIQVRTWARPLPCCSGPACTTIMRWLGTPDWGPASIWERLPLKRARRGVKTMKDQPRDDRSGRPGLLAIAIVFAVVIALFLMNVGGGDTAVKVVSGALGALAITAVVVLDAQLRQEKQNRR